VYRSSPSTVYIKDQLTAMGQLMLTLNGKEEKLLEDATPPLEGAIEEAIEEATPEEEPISFSRQDLIRALLLITTDDQGLLKEAQKCAAKGEKLREELKYRPGQAKGLGEEDYREAVQDEGSIKGAAEALGVTRTTVREQCVRYDIHVPSLGGVPE
jgi:hypothetical protein